MNSRGFTLIELLLVIVIVAMLGLSTAIVLKEVQNNNKENLLKEKYVDIQRAAKTYIDLNDSRSLSFSELGIAYVTIGELQSKGYLKSKLIDDVTSKEISANYIVKIFINKPDTLRYIDTCIIDENKNCVANNEGEFVKNSESNIFKCCE